MTDDSPSDPAMNPPEMSADLPSETASAKGPPSPAEQAKLLPATSGVYLMKDSLDRVIYIGKAVNLRSRVASYFTQQAAVDRRTADWVSEIHHIDHIDTDSEVDALLLEARLIKDIQPKFNQDLKDDKTFP